MDTELRKRFEKAAKEYAKRVVPECISSYEDFFNNTTADFRNGAKHGFKEAIAQVKEWLKEQGKDWWEGYGLPFSLADFEADMNKIWEEKK